MRALDAVAGLQRCLQALEHDSPEQSAQRSLPWRHLGHGLGPFPARGLRFAPGQPVPLLVGSFLGRTNRLADPRGLTTPPEPNRNTGTYEEHKSLQRKGDRQNQGREHRSHGEPQRLVLGDGRRDWR